MCKRMFVVVSDVHKFDRFEYCVYRLVQFYRQYDENFFDNHTQSQSKSSRYPYALQLWHMHPDLGYIWLLPLDMMVQYFVLIFEIYVVQWFRPDCWRRSYRSMSVPQWLLNGIRVLVVAGKRLNAALPKSKLTLSLFVWWWFLLMSLGGSWRHISFQRLQLNNDNTDKTVTVAAAAAIAIAPAATVTATTTAI